MTGPGGAPGRRWIGRTYAHLLLPLPYLTDAAIRLLDDAVTAADGWRPADGPAAAARVWRRHTGELRLAVLGRYPLIVTLGVRPGAGAAGRRALRRAADAALAVDGRLVGDTELPHRLASAADRAAAAADLRAELTAARAARTRRTCGACRADSGAAATHCDACGRRFDAADDAARDAAHAAAAERTAVLAAELDRLAADRPMRATGE